MRVQFFLGHPVQLAVCILNLELDFYGLRNTLPIYVSIRSLVSNWYSVRITKEATTRKSCVSKYLFVLIRCRICCIATLYVNDLSTKYKKWRFWSSKKHHFCATCRLHVIFQFLCFILRSYVCFLFVCFYWEQKYHSIFFNLYVFYWKVTFSSESKNITFLLQIFQLLCVILKSNVL